MQWIAAGADANGRAAALATGRADATLLTPPAYFRLEEAGFKSLGILADHDDIYAATTYLMKKSTIAANPRMPEQLIKAHAEAIKRFYDDKTFAVKAYQAYDRQTVADVERVYDGYAKANVLERVPYMLAAALQAVMDQQSDPKLLAQMKGFDFHASSTTASSSRLVKEGFFQKLFGPASRPKRTARPGWRSSNARTIAPITSEACCARRRCSPRAATPASRPNSSRRSKTSTSCACSSVRRISASEIFTDGELRRRGS